MKCYTPDTVSGNHFLLDSATGKVFQSIEYTIDSAPNEDIPQLSNHRMNLDYIENISFFQKQIGWPSVKEIEIIATDETSGTQLWSSTLPLVGRAAPSQFGVFALQIDGKVLHLNPVSGVSSNLVQFDTTLTKQYQYKEGTYQNYGYFVTVDNESQSLFVYLGDSRQLFAFKLPESYE
jgi:outer membrane protein assembly factor BamB